MHINLETNENIGKGINKHGSITQDLLGKQVLPNTPSPGKGCAMVDFQVCELRIKELWHSAAALQRIHREALRSNQAGQAMHQ